MTSTELINLYENHALNQNKSKIYIDSVCRNVKEFCTIMQISDVAGFRKLNVQYSGDMYLSFLRNNGNSPNSIKTKLAMVKVFFKYLHDKQFIETNILNSESVQGEMVDVTRFSSNDIVKVIYTSRTEQDFVVRMLLYASGIRISELVKLTANNVSDGVIKVLGKGDKWREVQVFRCVTNVLKNFIQKNNRTGLVFTNKRGGIVSARNISKTIKTTARKCSIENHEKLSPHKFRHTYSEILLNTFSVPIDVIGANLGHSSLGNGVASVTWQVYAKTSTTRVREFIDRIENDVDRRGGVGKFFKVSGVYTNVEEEYKKRFND